jgi:hypothetical protein
MEFSPHRFSNGGRPCDPATSCPPIALPSEPSLQPRILVDSGSEHSLEIRRFIGRAEVFRITVLYDTRFLDWGIRLPHVNTDQRPAKAQSGEEERDNSLKC